MKSTENVSATVNPVELATKAAEEAGAVCPAGVAEYLADSLVVVETAGGPTVMVRSSNGLEPLPFVMSRMKITPNVAALFHGGAVEPKTLDHPLYRVIRKHMPELVGLRPNRR